MPAQTGSDRVDLDELFRNVRPIGDDNDLAAPGVFESTDELDEFLAWLRADRAAGSPETRCGSSSTPTCRRCC
ncbi:MAG: hypothetical protein IPL41_12225 [Micropruina sp.]|nr:hypothetical protein [Micropruina sp.]